MSHDLAPTLIQMRLPSGQLVENEKYNVSGFASHFKRLLNNQKPTDRKLINDTDSRKVMRELDLPPSWSDFTSAIMELTNNKAPGINGIPPNAFKSMKKENLRHHFYSITEF